MPTRKSEPAEQHLSLVKRRLNILISLQQPKQLFCTAWHQHRAHLQSRHHSNRSCQPERQQMPASALRRESDSRFRVSHVAWPLRLRPRRPPLHCPVTPSGKQLLVTALQELGTWVQTRTCTPEDCYTQHKALEVAIGGHNSSCKPATSSCCCASRSVVQQLVPGTAVFRCAAGVSAPMSVLVRTELKGGPCMHSG